MLPNDFYDHDDRAHALVGRRWGRSFELGAPIVVKLAAAQPLTGGLTFEYVEGGVVREDDRAVRKLVGNRTHSSPGSGRRAAKDPNRLKRPNKSGGKRRRR
jgi:ribonuclease R